MKSGRALSHFASGFKRAIVRAIVIILGIWLLAIALFAFLPVPFSAVMIDRQVSAWLRGDFSYIAHSEWVSMDEIAYAMPLAVIAAEDQKFPQHWGFDLVAIDAALRHNEENEGRIRGASTLSQQTVKNLLLWDGRSWVRKGLEAGLTTVMELTWSKRRILTVYLNIVEFGPGIFGVEEASRHFFHKSASRLTASEAALLASVLPNPIRFRVDRPSGYMIRRQQWVLRQMSQIGGEAFLKNNELR
ncbi:monofunctional biosynthetic peptidoglycan transglycosylase [Lonsdalea populi]|uniref:monofunctional biosynthetic peptidoglycan transglycosylase n=1 Tax=Lonsdalea populi TaxID=1172565 RepID=UPI000A2572F0|nr:monofunctional biosynthetic peptidoglycan transglycosylase [Lonsdalea populi]OSM97450.1 monofunctional biosynthetic peptidoglycan transglycosylase [Lonsdalea populi]RAT72974.1 monofunctional biosynthetic peptidoglycan transglycosylase [Lonsdalea populi]RAT74198.1 monofunctional biosynthetic peptidoglycan transglycosylase [Lonsdalea populi]RAT77731.1 monofunctional biosynthetic peptidoglycan transglycosylase [Lonsdalea populi]RAT78321.1 monofunctional biosynthetic peptidoglycan transglycosyl